MKNSKSKSVRSNIERRVAVGLTASLTAMGATACGPVFLSAGGAQNHEGLKGLQINNPGEAVHVETISSGDNVQVDFKAPQALSDAGRKFDVTSVNCGTYNGNMNAPSVWEGGTGMSCHIDNVGNVSKIKKQVRVMLGESLEGGTPESQESTLPSDGTGTQYNEDVRANETEIDIPGYAKMIP